MPTRNVNLTKHFDRFVEEQVDSGRFRDASEVLRAGLRLLEQQSREEEETLALLRSLVTEGIHELDQGRGIEFNDEKQLARWMRRIGRVRKPRHILFYRQSEEGPLEILRVLHDSMDFSQHLSDDFLD